MFCTVVKSALNSVEYKIHGLNILRTSHGNWKALPFAIKLIRYLGLHCIDSAPNLNKVSVVPTSNVFLPGLRPFGPLLCQAEADTDNDCVSVSLQFQKQSINFSRLIINPHNFHFYDEYQSM